MRRSVAALALAFAGASGASAQAPVRYLIERRRVAGVPASRYDLRLPRVTGGARAPVRARVNAQIDSVAEGYTCGEGPDAPPLEASRYGGSARARVTRADARFLSFVVEGSGFCGGAHPVNTLTGYTFDLRTGEAVGLEGLGLREMPPALVERAYAPLLARARRDSVAAARHGREAGCGVPQMFTPGWEYRQEGGFALSPRGVIVWPGAPHALHACVEQATIPYASLRPYLSSMSRLR